VQPQKVVILRGALVAATTPEKEKLGEGKKEKSDQKE